MAEEGEGQEVNLFEETDLEFGNMFEELIPQDQTAETQGSTEESTQEIENSEENTEDTEQNTEETQEQNSEEESQEAEENSEEDTTSTEDTENSEENSSPLIPYAKLLVDEGILPNLNLEEFDGTGEGLVKAMDSQISSGIDEYKNQIPDQIKTLIENYEEGVPLNTLIEIDSRRTQYKSIAKDQIESNVDVQKALVTDFYKRTTRFSDERISKMVQQMEDLEELSSEAIVSQEGLVKLEDEIEANEKVKAQEAQAAFNKQAEEQMNTFKSTLKNTQEAIPGLKLNDKNRERIQKILTEPIAEDGNGNPLNEISKYRAENPYEYDIMLAYLYDSTKGFKDWSILAKSGKKTAIDELVKASERLDKNKGGGKIAKNKQTQSQSTKTIADQIAKFGLK